MKYNRVSHTSNIIFSYYTNSRKIIVIFVPLRVAVQKTGLHPNTLRKYADKGIIKAIRMSERGKRLFDIDSLLETREECSSHSPLVCYCRVSSGKQRDDLARQVASMWTSFYEAGIVQDIGSGLNHKQSFL